MCRLTWPRGVVLILAAAALGACSSTPHKPAPVYSVADNQANNKPKTAAIPAAAGNKVELRSYTVKRGDTLYSIAWRFGLDYQELARINDLAAPYEISSGDILALQPGAPRRRVRKLVLTEQKSSESATKITTSRIESTKSVSKQKDTAAASVREEYRRLGPVKHWQWPAKGRIIKGFSPNGTGNKGIDIAGRTGESVRAAAFGKVVYSGNGVRGYGNLLIIKHNSDYLSAYAYNRKILVKQGSYVRSGQKIAEMGGGRNERPELHFEIRRKGKPVNPTAYLRTG